jgi:sugar phosphate permease
MGGIGALFSSAPLAWVSNVIGWRMTFLSVGIITLLMAALAYAFVRNRPSEIGLPPINPVREEAQIEIGLMNGMRMVITSGRFWPPAVWAFCVIGISFAVGGLWGGPYLMQVYSLSKTSAGGVLSTFALALIFGSPVLGWSANRFGRKSILICCSVMLLVVSGIMGVYIDSMALPVLYVLFFGFFFSGGAVGPVMATVSKELFPIAISGTAVGAINLFPFAGGAIFQVLIGAVLTAQSLGQGQYTTVGFRHMFFICLAGAVLSLAAALLIKETLHSSEGLS